MNRTSITSRPVLVFVVVGGSSLVLAPHSATTCQYRFGMRPPGKCVSTAGRGGDFRFWHDGKLSRFQSVAVGVGNQDEDPFSMVRCPGVGSS